jgi:hypothetical protein
MGMPFPGKWSFKHHPWAREPHDCTEEMLMVQKAAQMSFTEMALNKTFYAIDIEGKSVLYVLPSQVPDAKDFSTSRFDPALELSSHLRHMFSDVSNIGHKRAGSANLFIRGSRSRSQMKSLPVATIVFDELDEMNQDNVVLALERTSGQMEKQVIGVSTPTIEGHGINLYFANSTQKHYYFRCPHCSRLVELLFPECLIITSDNVTDPKIRDSYLVCPQCKVKLNHEEKVTYLQNGIWVPSFSDRMIEGYTISQLYSMTVKPCDIAINVLKAESNPADEQELFNSKMGVVHTVAGARVDDDDIIKCTGSHTKYVDQLPRTMTVMGVDVGAKKLHVEIDEVYWTDKNKSIDTNVCTTAKVIWEGTVAQFAELDKLMLRFKVAFCVVDSNPERRSALEFAQRFDGIVKLCYYSRATNTRLLKGEASDDYVVHADRTSWMDAGLGRFKGDKKRIILPSDVSQQYKDQIKAPVRRYEKDDAGNPVGRYVKGNVDDHFAHARVYAEIAIVFAASKFANVNITESGV